MNKESTVIRAVVDAVDPQLGVQTDFRAARPRVVISRKKFRCIPVNKVVTLLSTLNQVGGWTAEKINWEKGGVRAKSIILSRPSVALVPVYTRITEPVLVSVSAVLVRE